MKATQNIVTKSLRLVHYYPRSIWWITSRVILLALLMTVARIYLQPRYTATATMTTLPSGFELKYTEGRIDVQSAFGPAMVLTQTHTEYLLSRTIAAGVMEQLKAEGLHVDNGRLVTTYVTKPVSSVIRACRSLLDYGQILSMPEDDALVRRLQKSTSVRNVPGSFILEISVRWSDPVIAARAVNMITDRYVELVRDSNQEEMRVTREFIKGRIAETSRRFDEIGTAIKAFKATEGFYLGNSDIELKMDEMTTYLKDMRRAEAAVSELESRLRILKEYQSPAVLSELHAELAGAQARRQALENSFKDAEAELSRFPELEQKLAALYREHAERAANLDILNNSLAKTEIAEASNISSVRTIDRAIVPLFPSGPRLLSSAMASILVGLLLSAAYIGSMEYVRPHLRCQKDFEQVGASLKGLVPFDQHANNVGQGRVAAGGEAAHARPSFLDRFVYACQREERRLRRKGPEGVLPGEESWTFHNRRAFNNHIDHLVDHLVKTCRGKAIAFTSLDEDKGKSFVIEHLAMRASNAGKRVLVIDANTVNPRMQQAFRIQVSRTTLADMMTGTGTLETALTPVAPGFDVVVAGRQSADNRVALDIAGMRNQLDAVGANYDLVMIDTPSLRVDPLVTRLWDLSSRMVCILDATTCTRDSFDDLRERLVQYDRPIDHVLNYVRFSGDYLYDS